MNNRRSFIGWLSLWCFVVGLPAWGSSTGVTTGVVGTCGSCHGFVPEEGVQLSLEGPRVLRPLEEASYVLHIRGGPLAAAGFNLKVLEGREAATLVAGAGSRLVTQLPATYELTHRVPRRAVGGEVTFAFRLKASPTPGPLTVKVFGNSVDLSNDIAGDQWNSALFSLSVEGAVSADGGQPEADAGVGLGDAGAADAGGGAEEMPSEETKPPQGGCSTAAGSAWGLVWVLAAGAWWPPRRQVCTRLLKYIW